MLASLALAFGIVTPALATKSEDTKKSASATEAVTVHNWDDCYDLAWIRGVHTEQGELPDFMEQCTIGSIPFGADFVRYYKRQNGKKFSG